MLPSSVLQLTCVGGGGLRPPACLACLQEHLLHLLLQPRQRYTEMEELEEEEEEDQVDCKGGEGDDMTRPHSGERTGRGRG